MGFEIGIHKLNSKCRGFINYLEETIDNAELYSV